MNPIHINFLASSRKTPRANTDIFAIMQSHNDEKTKAETERDYAFSSEIRIGIQFNHPSYTFFRTPHECPALSLGAPGKRRMTVFWKASASYQF